jgi:hypothetical protein
MTLVNRFDGGGPWANALILGCSIQALTIVK